MNRKLGITLAAISILVALVVVACQAPGWRLESERSSALHEGLALDRNDLHANLPIPANENGAQALNAAVGIFQRTSVARFAASDRVIAGPVTAVDRAAVGRLADRLEDSFKYWRAAAKYTKLDLSDGSTEWSYFSQSAYFGVKHLTAAAVIGRSTRENLVAAARLSALMRTIPTLEGQRAGMWIGRDCLTAATRLGLGKVVAKEMGPPTEPKFLLRSLLPQLLEAVRVRDKLIQNLSFLQRFQRGFLFQTQNESMAIHGWREVWRRLPSDYAGAATLLDSELPPLEKLGVDDVTTICFACMIRFGPSHAADTLREFDRFETLRKKALL